jgi:hypothetical protein
MPDLAKELSPASAVKELLRSLMEIAGVEELEPLLALAELETADAEEADAEEAADELLLEPE